MSRKKVFIITVLTMNKMVEWNIEPNTEINIPVVSSSKYHAESKFSNKINEPVFSLIGIFVAYYAFPYFYPPVYRLAIRLLYT